jgi:hypothetical protein
MSDDNNNIIRKLGGGSHPDGTIWEKTKFKNIWREKLTDDQKAVFFSWFKDLAIREGLPRSAGIVQSRLRRLEESQINMSKRPKNARQSRFAGDCAWFSTDFPSPNRQNTNLSSELRSIGRRLLCLNFSVSAFQFFSVLKCPPVRRPLSFGPVVLGPWTPSPPSVSICVHPW